MVATRSIERGSPAAKLRYMLSAPNGSTPMTSQPGASNFTADATPAHNPPPPIGTITASSPATCSHSSSPSVAVPSAVVRPSNGCTNVRPSSAAIRSTAAKPACASGANTISAP